MREIVSWLFTLIPLGIGLTCFALWAGWLRASPSNSKSNAEIRKLRRSALFGAVICTLAGLGCILQKSGMLDAFSTWARSIK